MAAVIATERRLRTRMPGRELVVQNVVNWRTVRGYGELWRGRSEWIWRPGRKAGGGRKRILRGGVNRGHTRRTTAAYFFKKLAWSKKKCPITLHRKAPYGAP